MNVRALCLTFSLLMLVAGALGGESGLNVIVVVNQNSTNSLQLGNDYCERRGVPPQNVLRMTNWTGGSVDFTLAQFTNYLLNPLLNMVQTRGLTNQAHIVLLSMDIPYRVYQGDASDSTTSALFYGFKTNGAAVVGFTSCSLPDDTSNSFCYAEMPFADAQPNTAATNSFMAFLLTDTNLASAENTLSRGVASDGTFPTQGIYLEETADTARNVRFLEADNAVFQNQVIGNYAVSRITSNNTLFTNLLGFQTGASVFNLETNEMAVGGIGDNLTSFGGFILDNNGQTTLLAFTEAGAVASYGTVIEPCNYLQKFPDPVDYFYQARGFGLAEAYYQCVQNPFQGLMVGEPLSAPFAHFGAGSWSAPANGAVLRGQTTLNLAFTSAETNIPLAQADLFVDGTFYQTMTNVPPAPGNVLSVTLNGFPFTYTIQTNDTLATAIDGLAEGMDEATNETQVVAYPAGDRMELQSQAIYVPGSNVTLSASAGIGSASRLTSKLTTPRPMFLDTIATGYHYVLLNNAPNVGDWLQLTIVKTNGDVINLNVTNTSGNSLNSMVNALNSLIQANPALASADGLHMEDLIPSDSLFQFFLYANTPGCAAAQTIVTLTASPDLQVEPPGTFPLADNLPDLLPKDHLYLSSGANSLSVQYNLNTTNLPDGWHQLTAVAYEGTSVRTQTKITQTVQIQNTGLTASLASLPAGNEVGFTGSLQFAIAANTTNLSDIQLFTTGGCVGEATNEAAADFVLAATNLGVGLHPFYALVTDKSGNRYRTQTISYRVVPTLITLTLAGNPPVLSWPATVGDQYYLQYTTNLSVPFQTITTITPTNTVAQWPIAAAGPAGYYRVELAP